jgi:hypothetical protein
VKTGDDLFGRDLGSVVLDDEGAQETFFDIKCFVEIHRSLPLR